MKHCASPRFWRHYRALPQEIQQLADRGYQMLLQDPRHPSLHFKRIGRVWSARVGCQKCGHCKAIGRVEYQHCKGNGRSDCKHCKGRGKKERSRSAASADAAAQRDALVPVRALTCPH